VAQGHIASDRAVRAKVFASHGLIDNCEERSALILKRKVATGEEWCVVRLEIIRRNEVD
jgi:hypothetical protein